MGLFIIALVEIIFFQMHELNTVLHNLRPFELAVGALILLQDMF